MDEKTKAVQRMQDYIQTHFAEEITLAALAKIAMFSPWYAHRLFKNLVGVSPADYIRKIRLTSAAQILKSEKCKITDLAFELGFESLDCFTRAFNREFGIKPNKYKNHPIPIPLFIPYGVKFKTSLKENRSMNDVKNIFIQVIQKPKRKVIIKRGTNASEYFEYCNEVGCDIWGVLTSMDSLCGEPVCLWLPKKFILEGTSKYVQGVEVSEDYNGIIPDGFDIITLPETKYLMFQGEPFKEENFMEAITNVQNAMKKYDPQIIGYKWDNEVPRIQLEPRGERGYIEMQGIKNV